MLKIRLETLEGIVRGLAYSIDEMSEKSTKTTQFKEKTTKLDPGTTKSTKSSNQFILNLAHSLRLSETNIFYVLFW